MDAKRGLIGVAVGTALAAGAALIAALTLGWVDQPHAYVVVKGDTLFEIAQDHSVSVDQLRQWNEIDGDRIEIGQVLAIWTNAAAAPARVADASTGRKKIRVAGSLSGATGSGDRPSLQMPEAKACLAGPSTDDLAEDRQMMASEGLSFEQISGAMRGFVSNTLPCISSDAMPSETLLMEVTVGCNGQVSSVDVLDGGDWPAEMQSCVTSVIGYAPFPAHGLPAGEVFQYPLRFTPG